MTTTNKLLEHLKKIAQKEDLIVNNTQYTLSQVKLAEQLLGDLNAEITKASTKPKLSRRRAFIVILEELYYDVKQYPEDLTIDKIHRRASLRFEYMNRDNRGFETPMKIHPKNPCLYYEDNGYGKARYKSSLLHLVNESYRYFKVSEAETSLKIILNEVKLC